MADLKSIKTDLNKASKGIWATYPGTDIRCLIARLKSTLIHAEMLKLRRAAKAKAALEGGLTTPEARKYMVPIVANHVLLDWENITENGQPIEHSREKALELLGLEELEDFYEWILTIASEGDLYRVEELVEEEETGNS